MQTPDEYWTKFYKCFFQTLKKDSVGKLLNSWKSPTDRTKYYVKSVFKQVEADLQLEHEEELFKVDAVYYDKSINGEKVPAIFIESENNAKSADHEIKKLCSLACPLAILITVVEWDIKHFPQTSKKEEYLKKWESIILAHSVAFPINGILAILVGEFGEGNKIRFYIRKYMRNNPDAITAGRIEETIEEIKKIS